MRAVLQTYACGSIDLFCDLLSVKSSPRKRRPKPEAPEPEPTSDSELMDLAFDVKPDITEE